MSSLREINEAFLKSYDRPALERLIRFTFDESLAAVANGPDFTATVFDLTSWAHRESKMVELIEAAQADSTNPLIQSLEAPSAREKCSSSGDDISVVLDQTVTNGELIDYRLREVQKEIEHLAVVLTGSDGSGGVRQTSLNNQRDIQDIKRSVARLEHALDAGPDLMKSRASKIVFGLIVSFLTVILLIVSAGAFGWV